MQVTVSRVSPVEVELKVSVPKEKVATALNRAYSALGKSAQIKGFRKGKVPLGLLKQYFGDRVTAEVTGKLLDETLPQALLQQKLEPVNQPQVDPGEIAENTDWTYTAKLEVRPEVENINLEGIELKRKVYQLTDAEVLHKIEHMREEQATLKTPDIARPARKGDTVTVDYDMSVDGTPRPDLNARNRSVEVGKGRLLPEIDDGLVGMGVGETKEIAIKFADDHGREDLRGKPAVFKLTVSEIREKIVPELDDEFAKDVGSESLDALKAKVRGDMEKEGQQDAEAQLREDAVTALAEKNPITVPPSMVQNAVGALAREVTQNLRIRGEEINAEEIMKLAREQAESRVRAGLLLGELARRNGLTVTEEDLNNKIEEMAKETNKAAARLRAEYRDARKRESLANAVLEDKVLKLLLSKVKIEDVPTPWPAHEHNH